MKPSYSMRFYLAQARYVFQLQNDVKNSLNLISQSERLLINNNFNTKIREFFESQIIKIKAEIGEKDLFQAMIKIFSKASEKYEKVFGNSLITII